MKQLIIGLLFCLGLLVLAWAGGLTLFPSAPVICISDNALGLTWDQNTEDDLAGYMIAYSVNDTDYTLENIFDVGNVTTFSFDQLPDDICVGGNVIAFVCHAYDTSALRSAASNEVEINFTTDDPPAAPGFLEKTY